jgi:hypothetical protein
MNAITRKIMRRGHAVLFVVLTLSALYLELTNGWPK